MRILFLSYWNINDPLTVATVYPGLRILQGFDFVEEVLFVNTERGSSSPTFSPDFKVTKIRYVPLFSRNLKWVLLNKIFDFIQFPKSLERIVSKNKIDVIIARGAPAGSLAYLVFTKIKTPFLVESFEPHADYMLESHIWGKFDLRYTLQRYWENKQKKFALGLLPVAENYKKQLIAEGVEEEKIKVVPCGVNEDQFIFNKEERLNLRTHLGIPSDAIVGVYAGKYDGLYLAEKAFEIYKIFFNQLANFNLILLSPVEYHPWIHQQIIRYELPEKKIFVKSVKHSEVGRYFSASDFAFATYKSGRSKAYLSPVKVGEYLANGLPILLTRGVGDESSIIENGFGGVLFDADCIDSTSLKEKISKLLEMIRSPETRASIARAGQQLRSFEKLELAYKYFLLKAPN